MIRHALIMAAGRGNRMRPFTDRLPKSMAPLKNDTLIGHNLLKLGNQVSQVHITVGYKKTILAKYLLEKGVATILNTEGHGNAWWLQNTLMRYVDEPVLVLTTDNITEVDVRWINAEYEACGSPAGMIVPTQPVEGIAGDFLVYEGSLVQKVARDQRSDRYCSGIQVVNPSRVAAIINDCDVDDFYAVWHGLIRASQLRTAGIYPYQWYSVDTLEQLVAYSKE